MLYTKEQIQEIIPHRSPMLMVDTIESIEEIEGKTVVRGTKAITGEEDFLKGHFPGYPVVPGVLILEAMAQCGACYALSLEEYKGKTAFFAGADQVKWKRMVVPGDILLLEAKEDHIRHGIGKAECKAYVKDTLVCSAIITFMIR